MALMNYWMFFRLKLFKPESVMLIQEYLPEMTPSQLFVTYAGGMATVGGLSLVIFMSSGVRNM
jgi:nucleoside permease NupC